MASQNGLSRSKQLISVNARPGSNPAIHEARSNFIVNNPKSNQEHEEDARVSRNGPVAGNSEVLQLRPRPKIVEISPWQRSTDSSEQVKTRNHVSEMRGGGQRVSPRSLGPKPLRNSRLAPLPGQSSSGALRTKPATQRKVPAKNKKPLAVQERQLPRSRGQSGAVVPSEQTIIGRRSYTARPIIPAKTAEVIDVARAMHRDQFASRLKKLFDPEREAALQAIETGLYIGWRCWGNDFDCIRVNTNSKCFCGHLLAEHASFDERRRKNSECRATGCACKQYAFIPSRPEDIGEWWLQKRPGYDVSSWRAKCRCKHTHEQHHPNGSRKCKIKNCACFAFDSSFLCAACDKHWEEHETQFDDINSRREKGLPYGEEYLPFHELPQLRNIVLTGNEDDNTPYDALTSGQYAIPRQKPTQLALQLRGERQNEY